MKVTLERRGLWTALDSELTVHFRFAPFVYRSGFSYSTGKTFRLIGLLWLAISLGPG